MLGEHTGAQDWGQGGRSINVTLHLQYTTDNIPETVVKEARFKGKESKANVIQFPPHRGVEKARE